MAVGRGFSRARTIALILVAVASVGAAATSMRPQHPYFQLDAPSKKALVEKAKAIKLGDSYQSVVSVLGKPTFDNRLMRKENNGVVGRSIKYYAVIWQSGSVNELRDELVNVFFDDSDRVKSVTIRVRLDQ